MIIDNIIVIIVAIILITYLSINYVRKYEFISLILVAISAFSLGIYMPISFFNYDIDLIYQILLAIGLFILPGIFALLQYNNISFSDNLLFKKAEKYYLDKKYQKCLQTLQKVIAADGRNGQNLLLLAKCYIKLDEEEEARTVLYDVIKIDENNYEAYFELGKILENSNDIDSAIDMYNEVLRLEPSFYDVYEVLGILLANQGDYEKAEELYKKAIEYHPESYELLYNLALVQLELSKNSEAEKNLEFALVINEDIPEAIYSLANIKMHRGDYSEALNLFSEIIKNETYGLKSYYKISMIYAIKNEFDKAMSVIEYIVNTDKSYIDVIKNEFVFNSMRSRINEFLENRVDKEEQEKKIEEEEIEKRKNTRKNWFSKGKEAEKESILYDDIDITRTGFRS